MVSIKDLMGITGCCCDMCLLRITVLNVMVILFMPTQGNMDNIIYPKTYRRETVLTFQMPQLRGMHSASNDNVLFSCRQLILPQEPHFNIPSIALGSKPVIGEAAIFGGRQESQVTVCTCPLIGQCPSYTGASVASFVK